MKLFERKNKTPIFITPSREIATTLDYEEMDESIDKLFNKIDEDKPKDRAEWIIKVNSHEICGVLKKLDYNLPTSPTDTLKIMLKSEYDQRTFRIQ